MKDNGTKAIKTDRGNISIAMAIVNYKIISTKNNIDCIIVYIGEFKNGVFHGIGKYVSI